MAKSKKPRASSDNPSFRLVAARGLRNNTLTEKHRLRLANILDPKSNDPWELILKRRHRGAPPKTRLTVSAGLLHGISDKKEAYVQNWMTHTGRRRSSFYYHLDKDEKNRKSK
jgi:hypothetical protein